MRLAEVVGVVCLGAGSAGAATCTVSSTADTTASGTLRYCLANYSSGDTINITATGTITLISALPTIGSSVTITGPGQSQLTISGANAYPVLAVSSSSSTANITISGVTIANGYGNGGAGGITYGAGSLTITTSTFSANSGHGGAIQGSGSLSVSTSTFSGNSSPAQNGGAISILPSALSGLTVSVSGSTFSGNSAPYGSAIYSPISGALHVSSSTFSGNTANTGGVIAVQATQVYVINNTFVGNSTTSGGYGALEIAPPQGGSSTVTASNNIFVGNSGRAIYNSNSSSTVNASYNVYYNNANGDCYECTTNTNSVDANPNLLPLGNYGGPTQTYLPQPGSVAICAGSSSYGVGDQRDPSGTVLPWGQCPSGTVDAGSVQSEYLEVQSSGDGSLDYITNCFPSSANCTLRNAIAAAANQAYYVDIDFAASVTTVNLNAGNGTLTIGSTAGSTVNIIGPGANLLTVEGNASASNELSVFTVDSGATATLYGITVNGGYAAAFGGGVNNSGTLTVINSAISGNTSYDTGGGIDNSGTMTIENSTVNNNTAYYSYGGGIANSGTATIIETTICFNDTGTSSTLTGYGGAGIYDGGGTMTVTNSTVSDNFDYNYYGGGYDGGGILSRSNGLTLYNTIVSGNGSYNGNANLSGSYTDGGGNVIGQTILLSNLQYTGIGATLKTLIPLPGSPAICAGKSSLVPSGITTDGRGYPLTTPGYCSSGQIDSGAVQTDYTSVAFVQQPTNTLENANMSPAPTVEVLETDRLLSSNNTDAVIGVPVTLTPSGGTYAGAPFTATTSSNSPYVASFSSLDSTTTAQGIDLVTSAITLAGSNSLPAVTSSTYNVYVVASFGTMSFSPAATEPQGSNVAVTISDTLTYSGAQPTGAVTFTLNGVGYTATCTSTGSPSGSPETCSATVPAAAIAGLGAASYTVTAALAADNNYIAATGSSGTFTVTYPTSYNASTEAVGTASATLTATVPFTTSFTVGSVSVLTLGATGLDFNAASGGTCASGFSATASNPCTVKYTFTPLFAGPRYGAIVVKDTSGNTQATIYLYGTGTGPQAVFNAPLNAATLGGGFSGPEGIGVDGLGDVYLADGNAIKKIPYNCGSSSCITTVGGGFNAPLDAAVDGAGNVYVADQLNNAVKETPAGCTSSTCVVTLLNGLMHPYGVAVDGSGNVYVADQRNSAIKRIPLGCTASSCVITLGGGFFFPTGVAVDGSGNVYVADNRNNAVKEIPSGCTTSSCVVTLGGGFSSPDWVAVDAAGEVYVSDYGNDAVKAIPVGCTSSGCVITLATGNNTVVGIALDGAGNLYYSDTVSLTVNKVSRTAAPTLSFSTSTAVGTTDTTDGTQTATVANIGNQALSFPVPGSGFNPSFPSGFVYDSSSTCSQLTSSSGVAATLAVGASCTLGVDFQPTGVGTNSGSVVISDTSLNGAYATQSIAVSGTGLKGTPTVTVLPAASYYGMTSATLSATVAYPGTAAPTGAFTFQVGSGAVVTATCTGTGSPLTCTASYSTGSLTVGSYTVTGSLAADSNDNSASNTGTLTVTANASNPETESVLWNFTSSSGDQSQSSLIQASDGNFYGTTYNSTGASPCGTVFQITPTGTYTVLYAFPAVATGGCGPRGGLVQGTDGNFYGTTFGGGAYGEGAIYKISSTSPYTFTLMHSFSQSYDGGQSNSALVQGNDGNFYGTTTEGGDNGDGTVFKISPNSPYTLTVLHSFVGGTLDGDNPGGLVQGTDGNFYGATASGGAHSDGIVYKISPNSPYTFTLMHSFSGSDGKQGGSALVQGTDGNFYGTTLFGGANNAGALFKISPTSPYTETVLHSFSNVSTDGDQPFGGLVEGSDGNFYGTTESAGANGVGLAYSISPSSPYTLSLLHSFANATTDGNTPYGGLAQGADGNFYGTTTAGGTNSFGVIYKLTPGSALAAPVSLSAPASVLAGAGFTLSYAVLNAPPAGSAVGTMQQCFATNTAGDTTVWTGVKTGYATATNASLTAPASPGTYTYTLTCGGTESSSVTVTVPGTAAFGTMSFSPAASEPQGTSVAVTVSDTVTYSGVQPTGAVTFTLNSVGYAATCTSTGSPETCSATVPAATIAALTRNSYTVTAALAADSNYLATAGSSGTFTVTYPLSYSAPTEPVGTASAAQTVTVPFTTTFTVGSVSVLTLGATGLDYNPASGGTCANGFSATPSTTCTVKYTFTPKFAGARYGAIVVKDTSGNTQATVYLNGTGTGPQAVFNAPLTAATLGGGFSNPDGVAVDGSGNVYISDQSNNAVKEIPSGCSSSSCVLTLGGGFSIPAGVAVDGAGNVYVADSNNLAVKEIPPGCTSSGCVTTLGGVFYSPGSVAVDGSGNVYVANGVNSSGTTVAKMPPGCASSSCVITISLGNVFADSLVSFVAVDASGDLYLTAHPRSGPSIYEFPSGCTSSSCATALGGGFGKLEDVAVDASGNIYVADNGNNALKVMPSGCTSSSCVTTLATGFNSPYGIALDGGGNVYVADSGNKLLKKLDRVDAPTLTFATATPVGSTDTTDGAQTATLANIGNQALSFSVPATGTNPSLSAGFVRDSGSTCTQVAAGAGSAGTLAAGASCTLGVDFVPTAIGNPVTGTAVFTDNSLNVTGTTQTVALSGAATVGTATFGTMSFSPSASETAGTNAVLTIRDTVTYGGAQPTGAVTFVLNGVTYTATCTTTGSPETCSATVPGNTIALLSANSYTVTAALAADSNYNAATGASGTFTLTSSNVGIVVFNGLPSPAIVGESGTDTVVVYTASNGPAVGVTITLTSSDPAAVLPAPYTLTAADGGSHTFTITLNTLGTQTLTVSVGGRSQTQTGIVVGDAIWALNPAGTLLKLNEAASSVLGGAVGTAGSTSVLGGVAFDSSGNGWSVTSGNNTLDFINKLGTGAATYTGGGLNAPAAVAVDGAGYVWIANSGTNTISEFNNAGTAQSGATGMGAASIGSAPSAIAIDNTGGVWVANKSSNSVTHVFGAAKPVITPLATATTNGTLGTAP